MELLLHFPLDLGLSSTVFGKLTAFAFSVDEEWDDGGEPGFESGLGMLLRETVVSA